MTTSDSLMNFQNKICLTLNYSKAEELRFKLDTFFRKVFKFSNFCKLNFYHCQLSQFCQSSSIAYIECVYITKKRR